MNLTELIMSANARGHIGVRGTLTVIPDKHATFPALENVLAKAEALSLIRFVSAWRSTEDDLPDKWGGPVDRRIYALTHKGWDLKINARDTLPSYKASILAEALAAHYGELEEGPDLRYPEEAFNDWQGDPCTPRIVGMDFASGPDRTAYGTCPAHQAPRGPMPNTVIDPPAYVGKELVRHGSYDGNYDTPTEEHPRVVMTEDGILHDVPYPGHELAVPDDHWSRRKFLNDLALDWVWVCAVLTLLAVAGWWLS